MIQIQKISSGSSNVNAACDAGASAGISEVFCLGTAVSAFPITPASRVLPGASAISDTGAVSGEDAVTCAGSGIFHTAV